MNVKLLVEHFETRFDSGEIEYDGQIFYNFYEYFAKIIHDEFLFECYKLIMHGGPSGGFNSAEVDLNKSKFFEMAFLETKNKFWEEYRSKRQEELNTEKRHFVTFVE